MAARPSLKIIHEFDYRGDPAQEFSNRHHFAGGVPANAAAWEAFADDVILNAHAGDDYQQALSVHVTVVKARGYPAGSDVAVWEKDYAMTGTRDLGGHRSSGDSAAMLRWTTDALTSRNHPIYLFSYIHGVGFETGLPDELNHGERDSLGNWAQRWWDAGFTDGANVYRRCGPNGAVALSSEVDRYVRHRDFPT